MEFFLDKGQEKDWFSDPDDQDHGPRLPAVLIVTFIWWEWRHPDPIVDIKLLKNRNFGTAVFLQLILGMVLFGSTVLIPQFLQTLLGYTAERAGEVLSPAGFVMMAGMFLAGRSLNWKIDPRLTVAIGYTLTAAGLYNLTRLSLDSSFGTLTLWRVLQVAALPFIFIPISTLNYVGVPRLEVESDFEFVKLLAQSRRLHRHRAADDLPGAHRADPPADASVARGGRLGAIQAVPCAGRRRVPR